MLAHSYPAGFDCCDLISIFNRTFLASHNTQLVSGGLEPLYSPPSEHAPASIVFTHDYFSSALHEIAHWLIAGDKRRQQEDYGYWYCPDGRTATQQTAFEQVEVSPQALEWILSKACGCPFRLSLDNLTGSSGDGSAFATAVYERVIAYIDQGLPPRANTMRRVLVDYYGTAVSLNAQDFTLEEIYPT
jgi:elongation factor P hydroxylase